MQMWFLSASEVVNCHVVNLVYHTEPVFVLIGQMESNNYGHVAKEVIKFSRYKEYEHGD